jgi:hypothetical protein
MIEMALSHEDLGRLRFSHSPLRELVMSLRALRDPKARAVYGPWIQRVQPTLNQLDADLLLALSPVSRHAWKFLVPEVTGPWGDLGQELGALVKTPHPEMSFRDNHLYIDKAHHCVQRYDLNGTGILLMPCVFSWPTLAVACCGTDQPLLIYPSRGAGDLAGPTDPVSPEGLSELLGPTRAVILSALAQPQTTTSLAKELTLPPDCIRSSDTSV